MKKPLRLRSALAFTVSLVVATPALAETFDHTEAGLTVWLPDAWSIQKKGNHIVVTDPAEATTLHFDVVKARRLEAALEDLEASLDDEFVEIEMDDEAGVEHRVHGLDGFTVHAVGVDDEGFEVDISVMLIAAPKRSKALLAISYTDLDDLPKYERTIEKIWDSVRPLP